MSQVDKCNEWKNRHWLISPKDFWILSRYPFLHLTHFFQFCHLARFAKVTAIWYFCFVLHSFELKSLYHFQIVKFSSFWQICDIQYTCNVLCTITLHRCGREGLKWPIPPPNSTNLLAAQRKFSEKGANCFFSTNNGCTWSKTSKIGLKIFLTENRPKIGQKSDPCQNLDIFGFWTPKLYQPPSRAAKISGKGCKFGHFLGFEPPNWRAGGPTTHTLVSYYCMSFVSGVWSRIGCCEVDIKYSLQFSIRLRWGCSRFSWCKSSITTVPI